MWLNAVLTSPNHIQLILAEVPNVVQLMVDVAEDLIENPIFAFLFAIGFARIAMSLIRKAKKASR